MFSGPAGPRSQLQLQPDPALQGVEVAAEIITAYPDKKVTLVHSGAYLLAPKGAAYGKNAFNFLTSKGVKVCWLAHVLHKAGATKSLELLALHSLKATTIKLLHVRALHGIITCGPHAGSCLPCTNYCNQALQL